MPDMIISASRRTDIPAFYSRWFMNRVREGFCSVANPFNAKQVFRVSLKPEDVDALVFWTRDPSPMVPFVLELEERGLPCFFLVTVLSYPVEYEPSPPDTEKAVRGFHEIADLLGPGRFAWRYDPVILSDRTDSSFHKSAFSQIAERVSGASSRCIVSVLDLYPRVKKAFRSLDDSWQPWSGGKLEEGLGELMPFLFREAGRKGFAIQSCAEEHDLSAWGIHPGACIDAAWIAEALGREISDGADPHQRDRCLCAKAKDIGVYGTCPFGCRYCYATGSRKKAIEALEAHDLSSPSLGKQGHRGNGDVL